VSTFTLSHFTAQESELTGFVEDEPPQETKNTTVNTKRTFFIFYICLFYFFLAIALKVLAKLYLLVPGLHVGPPNLGPVQTPSVPLRLIEAVAFCIHFPFFTVPPFFIDDPPPLVPPAVPEAAPAAGPDVAVTEGEGAGRPVDVAEGLADGLPVLPFIALIGADPLNLRFFIYL